MIIHKKVVGPGSSAQVLQKKASVSGVQGLSRSSFEGRYPKDYLARSRNVDGPISQNAPT